MSRSYKKHPVIKDGSSGRRKSGKLKMKTVANRMIRRKAIDELPMREKGSYKKAFESWDISDWRFSQTKEEAIREYEQYQKEAAGGPRYDTRTYFTYNWETGEPIKHTYTTMINRRAIEMIEEYPTLKKYLANWYKSYKRK